MQWKSLVTWHGLVLSTPEGYSRINTHIPGSVHLGTHLPILGDIVNKGLHTRSQIFYLEIYKLHCAGLCEHRAMYGGHCFVLCSTQIYTIMLNKNGQLLYLEPYKPHCVGNREHRIMYGGHCSVAPKSIRYC